MPKRTKMESGEATRPSTLVNHALLPGVQEREQLNRLLRVHDPDGDVTAATEISARYAPILRQIAAEGAPAGADPVVRKRAIAWLGRFAAPDDMNALVALAQYDLDPNIRGAAVLSLGASGAQLAAPILAAALRSSDLDESVSASKALGALADRIGAERVLASISSVRDAALSRLAKAALAARAAKPRVRKRSSTNADDEGKPRRRAKSRRRK